jgi:hypothetical protein
MKVRQGFVSNSSTSSFIITNKSDKMLNVVDLVIDLSDRLGESYLDISLRQLLNDAEQLYRNNYNLKPKISIKLYVSNEDDNYASCFLSQILNKDRDEVNESENFTWEFKNYYG